MSDATAGLRRKIANAGDLQSVVRTMKAVAAASVGQYDKALRALGDYDRTVELGLGACLRARPPATSAAPQPPKHASPATGAVVFGSDQGLVGPFNDVVAECAITTLAALPGETHVWAVGERVRASLVDAGIPVLGVFPVPGAVAGITRLVGQIQLESEAHRAKHDYDSLYVFHNRPRSGSLYDPVSERVLPLDAQWRQRLTAVPWPTGVLPQIMGVGTATLGALVREYLFITLFRACAESLASENASRLAAMQRADRNIDDLLETLNTTFHRLRQTNIDEELFDVMAGFEALSKGNAQGRAGDARSEVP